MHLATLIMYRSATLLFLDGVAALVAPLRVPFGVWQSMIKSPQGACEFHIRQAIGAWRGVVASTASKFVDASFPKVIGLHDILEVEETGRAVAARADGETTQHLFSCLECVLSEYLENGVWHERMPPMMFANCSPPTPPLLPPRWTSSSFCGRPCWSWSKQWLWRCISSASTSRSIGLT